MCPGSRSWDTPAVPNGFRVYFNGRSWTKASKNWRSTEIIQFSISIGVSFFSMNIFIWCIYVKMGTIRSITQNHPSAYICRQQVKVLVSHVVWNMLKGKSVCYVQVLKWRKYLFNFQNFDRIRYPVDILWFSTSCRISPNLVWDFLLSYRISTGLLRNIDAKSGLKILYCPV